MKVAFGDKTALGLSATSAWAVSHAVRSVPGPLQPVLELLGEMGCEFLQHRWSRSNVPHVVLQFHSQTYSVCYFGRDKFYRIFFPYGGHCAQEHYDCKTPQEVVDFIRLQAKGA